MRGRRRRRDVLVTALADALPEAIVRGAAAGLHVAVELADGSRLEAVSQAVAPRRS
jgi:GntR family transcriptional regulator/MocR family aminotransferase